MDRRQYLAGVVVALAGCGGDDTDSTPEPTPTATRTATATPTPTPTGTPTPATTLQLSDGFTNGSLTYRVTGIEMLGGDHQRATDGQIVHAIVEVTNDGDETHSATHPDSIYLISGDEQIAYNQYSSYWDATREVLAGKTASGYVEYEIAAEKARADIDAVVIVFDDGPAVTWTV
jgi:hypothetical protein